ncbi:hypothetical protein, partial [Salmonella enterica]|uniref:hypothetical protein n=1 Tax=Salmonella enterica TaxID=28901 RepID=UPI00398C2754
AKSGEIKGRFAGGAGGEQAGEWVDSITEAGGREHDEQRTYQAGTWGPVASVAMITRDGRSWNEFE